MRVSQDGTRDQWNHQKLMIILVPIKPKKSLQQHLNKRKSEKHMNHLQEEFITILQDSMKFLNFGQKIKQTNGPSKHQSFLKEIQRLNGQTN